MKLHLYLKSTLKNIILLTGVIFSLSGYALTCPSADFITKNATVNDQGDWEAFDEGIGRLVAVMHENFPVNKPLVNKFQAVSVITRAGRSFNDYSVCIYDTALFKTEEPYFKPVIKANEWRAYKDWPYMFTCGNIGSSMNNAVSPSECVFIKAEDN